MIRYDIKIEGLDRLQAAFQRAPQLTIAKLTTATNKSLVRLQATAKQLSPVDQGTLRSSILAQPVQVAGSTITGSVEATAPHAEWVERGTGVFGPHGTPIRPKTKPVLAWKKGGTWHFAKEVKGMRPRWYMRGTVERDTATVNRYFATAADEIATALAGGAA